MRLCAEFIGEQEEGSIGYDYTVPPPNRLPKVNPRLTAFALVAFVLAGCSHVPQVPGLKPYRMDIQQGNYVSQDMVAKLKRGMTKDQVRYVLGTPLVTDIFHDKRWDYIYYHDLPNGKREERKLTVYFDNGRLDRVTGDVVPAGEAGAAGKAEESGKK